MLQTSLLFMKSLNKTETPIFLSVVCSLSPKAIFLTFIITSWAPDKSDISELGKCTSFCILSPWAGEGGAVPRPGLSLCSLGAVGAPASGRAEATRPRKSSRRIHTELFGYVGASRRTYRIVCLRGSPFGAQKKVVHSRPPRPPPPPPPPAPLLLH